MRLVIQDYLRDFAGNCAGNFFGSANIAHLLIFSCERPSFAVRRTDHRKICGADFLGLL